jgi:hypothetical protein
MRAWHVLCITLMLASLAVAATVANQGIAGASTPSEWAVSGGWGDIEHRYFNKYSVFCASRSKSMSCVYVPRDTVR